MRTKGFVTKTFNDENTMPNTVQQSYSLVSPRKSTKVYIETYWAEAFSPAQWVIVIWDSFT